MKSSLSINVFAAVALLAVLACAKQETDPPPSVATTGPHAVAVGATITVAASTSQRPSTTPAS